MLNGCGKVLSLLCIVVVALSQIGMAAAHSAPATSSSVSEQKHGEDRPGRSVGLLAPLVEDKKLIGADTVLRDGFGYGVTISGDTVVVGVKGDDDAGSGSGSAYVFDRDEGGTDNWGEVKKLTASDADGGDDFGVSVALSGDTLVVGARDNADAGVSSGSAYVFERNLGGPDNWGEVKKLTASDAATLARFGESVSISGDTVVVGAWGNADQGAETGAVYVFDRDQGGAGNWGEVKKLSASDAAAGDNFGDEVAVSGDTVVVGSYGADAVGNNSGAAYVFDRDEGGADNWGEVKKLISSDATAFDFFGASTTISGDTAVVGAWGNDDVISSSGSAYVFERDQGGANNWGEVKKLTASDAAEGDFFGEELRVDGDRVVIGAYGSGHAGVESGAAYVFGRDEGGTDNWGEVYKLTASDAAAGDVFGNSVGISGHIAVVGADGADAIGTNSGAAYVFGPFPGIYVLDGYGEVFPGGGADSLSPEPPSFGFDIARDIELAPVGAYVLDGFGGVHPAAGAPDFVSPPPPYFGFDIARDIELPGTGVYVLDGFGGVHSVGGAAGLFEPPPPYFGFDIARDMELASTGVYVLDGFGGVHAVGGAPALGVPPPPYFGFDIARDMEEADTIGLYVLDGFGGVHAVGGAPDPGSGIPYFGFDAAVDLEMTEGGFYVLDGFGGLHRGGDAPKINPLTPYFGTHIAKDLELR